MHLPAEPLNHARQTVAGPRSIAGEDSFPCLRKT